MCDFIKYLIVPSSISGIPIVPLYLTNNFTPHACPCVYELTGTTTSRYSIASCQPLQMAHNIILQVVYCIHMLLHVTCI